MAVTVTYTCDKCGMQQPTSNQFWTVGIKAQCSGHTSDQYISNKFKMEICRPCLEYLGIHPTEKTVNDPEYQPPTLEELIREIVERCQV